ncbi:hypothetical protein GUITHDRAFT_99344 [Guillardia theta CCMP2712]|uniref:Fibronectin type-III domain-containing protein n=1 Tax=Guillardia theta (strain CCMP2712) TaxID=905079 RepID=L1K2U3_GUITC|nr:hypothetical protein GUITHDRAFT_99344 [Guillardia theta CCMP2712]EKX54688.1 hypothetical protein GUITHDRAFT_99344 [Guillardia theta CCMP2712]|eukprot:XP_005841668.1 hypothetical protein GUITHDRAFT_99344 [Guillardia theta CCMP2712]
MKDSKRLFMSNVDFDRYGRIKKSPVAPPVFEEPLSIRVPSKHKNFDRRDRATSRVAGGEERLLAPAGVASWPRDMSKIEEKITQELYPIIDGMQLDVFLIVLNALLSERSGRDAMKSICDARGRDFGGQEPELLPPAMPARLWMEEEGRIGVGLRALAWIKLCWTPSNFLGGWSSVTDRRKSLRPMSAPSMEYELKIQPLPFPKPFEGCHCRCDDHSSFLLQTTGVEKKPGASGSVKMETVNVCLVGNFAGSLTADQLTKCAKLIQNLQPAHQYEVKIRSFIRRPKSGEKLHGTWSEGVKLSTRPAPPAAPSNLRCSRVTEEVAELQWEEPRLKHGADLIDFEVCLLAASWSNPVVLVVYRVISIEDNPIPARGELEGSSFMKRLQQTYQDAKLWSSSSRKGSMWSEAFVLGPFLPSSEIQCKVRARSSSGWGEFTETLCFITSDALPSPPLNVSMEATAAEREEEGRRSRPLVSCRIRWSPPAFLHCRSGISKYEVKVCERYKNRCEEESSSLQTREWVHEIQLQPPPQDQENSLPPPPPPPLPRDYEFEELFRTQCMTQEERNALALAEANEEEEEEKGKQTDDSKCEASSPISRGFKGAEGEQQLLLEGFKPGSKITAKVRCFNVVGASDWSEEVEVYLASSFPAPPLNVRAMAPTFNTLVVGWDVPRTDHGSSITFYEVCLLLDGRQVIKRVNGRINGVKIAGLATSRQITELVVYSINAVGISLPSHPPLSLTLPPVPKSAS